MLALLQFLWTGSSPGEAPRRPELDLASPGDGPTREVSGRGIARRSSYPFEPAAGSFECDPEAASQVYEDVQACIEDCNDNTLPQWSDACADLTRAAWECNAALTCEQSAAAKDDPGSSPCKETCEQLRRGRGSVD